MMQIDAERTIIEEIIKNSVDRLQACNEYRKLYPHEEYDANLHVIISDYNIEDYFILSAIENVAGLLQNMQENLVWRRQLRFLVGLLDLPLPNDWDDED